MSYVSKSEIEAASETVYRHMLPTPQICWPLLAERSGAEVWVKHENHTPIGAFKVRGGLNYMTQLKADQPDCPGVISATRGNHGQSIALAAAKVGMKATIVIPFGNSTEKNAAMRALGAELIEHGEDFQEAYEYCIGLADEKKLHLVRSFHPWLVAGVGVYAYELMSNVPDLDTVYVPIGLGSGISGMISARDALGLKTKIVGVVPENAASYALSFEARKSVPTNTVDTIADGTACRVPDEAALSVILKGAERIVRVTEQGILDAMQAYYTDTHNVAEGAGAVPLAALLQERDKMAGKKVGLILSGGNVDKALFARVLSQ